MSFTAFVVVCIVSQEPTAETCTALGSPIWYDTKEECEQILDETEMTLFLTQDPPYEFKYRVCVPFELEESESS